MAQTYRFKLAGLPKDSEFNRLPFGRQIEHRRHIEAFKATAKSVHFSAKRTTTRTALREFLALYQPTQYFMVDTDGLNYHDDSFQVWYIKACIDCGKTIEELADFPGPRCLTCHAAKVEHEPLTRPDFRKTINKLR